MKLDSIRDTKTYPLLARDTDDTIRVFIIRHGETSYNKKKIMQGHLNIPLNEQGIEQSEQLNKFLTNPVAEGDIFLSKKNIDSIYTSDLKRCMETVEYAIKNSGREQDLIISDQLRERFMGEVQGMSRVDAAKKVAAEGKNSIADYGETIVELQDRIEKYLKDTVIQQAVEKGEKNVVVFSHGASIRYLLLRLFNNSSDYLFSKLPAEQKETVSKADSTDSSLFFGNTCVNIVDYNIKDKAFELKLMNGLYHITDDSVKFDETSNGTIV